jgi:hypothetical protein
LKTARSAEANAESQRKIAEHSATVATSRSLGANGIANGQLDLALLLAVQGVRLDSSVETRSDLLTTLERSPSAIAVMHLGSIGVNPNEMAMSPDGKTLALLKSDSSLWFYDLATRAPLGDPVANVDHLAGFTPDGAEVAVQRGPGLEMIDTRTRAVIRRLKKPSGFDIARVALSGNGRTAYALAPSTVDGGLGAYMEAWDTETAKRIPPVLVTPSPTTDSPTVPVVAEQANEVVNLSYADGGRIEVRDGATLALKRSFKVPFPPNVGECEVAVTSDGRSAAYVCYASDSAVRFVDLRTGAIRVGTGGQGGISGLQIDFSPDGRTLAMTTIDNKILLWDTAKATVSQTLVGQSGIVNDLVFDPSAPRSTPPGRTGTCSAGTSREPVPSATGSRSARGHGTRTGPSTSAGTGRAQTTPGRPRSPRPRSTLRSPPARAGTSTSST